MPVELVQPTYLEIVLTENVVTFVIGGPSLPGNGELTEVPSGLINDVNRVFTVSEDFSSIKVYLGGLRQKETVDYTITDTNEITFNTAPWTGAELVVDYVPA